MPGLRFDQVNIVVADVAGTTDFLRSLGADVPRVSDDWTAHHVGVPTASGEFHVDLDSPAFASYWGGLLDGFTGVVVNLRTEDRADVDDAYARALALGAEALREPYDAFWGSRYAVVRGPGPVVVGLMSRREPLHESAPPDVSDFASTW